MEGIMVVLNPREHIVNKAIQLVEKKGSAALTLEAVAKSARMSKGGLLHHFPNKNALIQAVLMRIFQDFRQRVYRYYEAEPDSPGRWLRAYIRASFEDDPIPFLFSTEIMQSLLEREESREMLMIDTAYWNEVLASDGVSEERMLVIRYAADGYMLDQWTMGKYAQRQPKLKEELLKLASGE
jgi:AcrR family transcriptional regulator